MIIENNTKTISQDANEDMQNYIRKELAEIEGLDEFIQHWVGEGKDISQIKWDIDERDLRKKSLEVYCRKNGKDIKDYYKNE